MSIKLYAIYTSSHQVLLNEYFRPSLKDTFDLIIERHEQECPLGTYRSEGWDKCMKRKIDIIIRAVKENWGRVFIHSDIDIQFFRPVVPTILKLIRRKDMVIQSEGRWGGICPGFFAAYGNEKNLLLWEEIRKRLEKDGNKSDDERLLNDCLVKGVILPTGILRKIYFKTRSIIDRPMKKFNYYKNPFGIKWDYLPESFYSFEGSGNKFWSPGIEFKVPKNIILHHANWTKGIDNKIALLKYVRNQLK